MTAKVAKNSNRGSKPGERRGGRKQGVPNKATLEIKDLARQYTVEALEALVSVVRGDSDTAKVAAANALLDRGYGKPSSYIEGKIGVDLSLVAHKIIDVHAGN